MMPSSITVSLLAVIITIYCNNVQSELKLLNVVFRHGDRTPDNNGLEIYPNDPYRNYSFEPMKLGGLTNSGKMREYNLGMHLRKKYGYFLGDIYSPDEVSGRSSDIPRTKMSLQLVLAALYPPQGTQIWNQNLNWQPIPTTYVPMLDDILMVPELCPDYLEERAKAEASEEYQNKLKKFKPFMKKLTILTGELIENSYDMYELWFDLNTEDHMNLTLPQWTYGIYPNGKLRDGINLEYDIASFNKNMKRLNGGMLLRKFVDDMFLYISKDKRVKNEKIKLYSGYETNIAALLQTLGVYYPHPPAFSSAVFVELHKDAAIYSVKVTYYKGIPSEEEEMTIKGCGSPCTLQNFVKILREVIPSREDLKCDKRSLESKLKNNEIHMTPKIIQYLQDAIDEEKEKKLSEPL